MKFTKIRSKTTTVGREQYLDKMKKFVGILIAFMIISIIFGMSSLLTIVCADDDKNENSNNSSPTEISSSETITTVSEIVTDMLSMTTTSTSVTTTSSIVETTVTTTQIDEDDWVIVTPVIVTDVVDPEPSEYVVEEYMVYKPSTHYIHMSTCRWFDSSCYEITDTTDIECRKCSECNPDIDIVNEYEEPIIETIIVEDTVPDSTVSEPVVETNAVIDDNSEYPIGSDGLPHASLLYISDIERIYLCNTVAIEYGCDWIPIWDKGCVVATVMNRVRMGGWTNGKESNIYNVLTAPHQYNPSYATPSYNRKVTQGCIDAVDYYFTHQDEFSDTITSFYGDGKRNYFR